MKKLQLPKRHNYEQLLEAIGFIYHDLVAGNEALPYWDEGRVYGFRESEIDFIQESTQELHDMCLAMVAHMVKSGDYPKYFGLSDLDMFAIEQSWKREDPSLMGRFDLVYHANSKSIKMLEYNGDTPVSLLEASIAQWDYIREVEGLDERLRIQYNLLHEQLIATWKRLYSPLDTIHFAQEGDYQSEDWCNVAYLAETAYAAGLLVKEIRMGDIGWSADNRFVDLEYLEINNIYKLYPWEWMFKQKFGANVVKSQTRWLEPAWKALLSNKAMLVKLWELNPNHPLLLEAVTEKDISFKKGLWARKNIHGREGSNVYQYDADAKNVILASGSHLVADYDQWGYIYQRWHDLPVYDGYRPILGSWVIGDTACGMSVREDANLVTGHSALFASHFFVPEELEGQFTHLTD